MKVTQIRKLQSKIKIFTLLSDKHPPHSTSVSKQEKEFSTLVHRNIYNIPTFILL